MTDRPPAITPRGTELPEGAGRPFDAAATARAILADVRSGALATNDPQSGFPLATLVNVATDADGAPLLCLSGLALHARNLAADPRASLLLAAPGKGDPLAHPRLTLVGTFAPSEDPGARDRFLAAHAKAQLYIDLPDFRFWRMIVAAVHLNGGFARAATLAPGDLVTDGSRPDRATAS